jgi:dTDP-4-dehydrorhamnose reductase
MRVLITGGGGQLATRLVLTRPESVEAIALSRADLDIVDARNVTLALREIRPDIVVNTAAYTGVDRAESDAVSAEAINATGPANLARIADQSGIRLIHISTDFVFDGSSGSAYQPGDPTNPVNEYGRSKVMGEASVRGIMGNAALILRTAWLYSAHGKGFLATMLRLMRERGEVSVVCDQIGTPTSVNTLAQALWRAVAIPSFGGTHHFTDAGVASWYDFAMAISEEAKHLRLVDDSVVVKPIRTDQYPTPARRPACSVLDKTSTVEGLGISLQHWQAALRDEMSTLGNV